MVASSSDAVQAEATSTGSSTSSGGAPGKPKQPKQQAGGKQDHLVFLSGAVSGVVEGMTIQPLELLKTRFQINKGERLQLLPTIREIIREGGVRQLYRGGLPEISGLIPRATAALSTLEFSQRVFKSWDANNKLATRYAYLSGSLSGVTESVVFSPFQVIKVRLMAKEHLGRYKNTLDCLSKVVAAEGLGALFIGLTPTLCRNCIWNSIYYGTMHEIETHHMPPLQNATLEAVRSFATGMAVGFTATCFNAPFDVVKSRVQSQLPDQRRYTGTVSALTTIYREEGATALYRGFLPKALRLGIGQTIGLMVFKACLKAFGVHERPDPQVLEANTAMS